MIRLVTLYLLLTTLFFTHAFAEKEAQPTQNNTTPQEAIAEIENHLLKTSMGINPNSNIKEIANKGIIRELLRQDDPTRIFFTQEDITFLLGLKFYDEYLNAKTDKLAQYDTLLEQRVNDYSSWLEREKKTSVDSTLRKLPLVNGAIEWHTFATSNFEQQNRWRAYLTYHVIKESIHYDRIPETSLTKLSDSEVRLRTIEALIVKITNTITKKNSVTRQNSKKEHPLMRLISARLKSTDSYSFFGRLTQPSSTHSSQHLPGSYHIHTGIWVNHLGEVTQVHPGTSAEKAGIRPGHSIERIYLTKTREFATNKSPDLLSEILHRSYQEHTPFNITYHNGTQSVEKSLWTSNCLGYADLVRAYVTHIKGKNILIIKIPSFVIHNKKWFPLGPDMSTSAQVSRILDGSYNNDQFLYDALVFDLRGNSGGYSLESDKVVAQFLGKGEHVTSRKMTRYSFDYQTHAHITESKEDRFIKIPIALLINAKTASAGEKMASLFQAKKRGLLLGSTTFGKGVEQSIIPLSFGGHLKYTSGYILGNETRNSFHQVGVAPDIFIRCYEDVVRPAFQKETPFFIEPSREVSGGVVLADPKPQRFRTIHSPAVKQTAHELRHSLQTESNIQISNYFKQLDEMYTMTRQSSLVLNKDDVKKYYQENDFLVNTLHSPIYDITENALTPHYGALATHLLIETYVNYLYNRENMEGTQRNVTTRNQNNNLNTPLIFPAPSTGKRASLQR